MDRWMVFVDGENLTIRAQEYAQSSGLTLIEGPMYKPDTFIWIPGVAAKHHAIVQGTSLVAPNAIRAHYYTSVYGDIPLIQSVREELWRLGFMANVFKKTRRDQKRRGSI